MSDINWNKWREFENILLEAKKTVGYLKSTIDEEF
jgi:hypothetical protein